MRYLSAVSKILRKYQQIEERPGIVFLIVSVVWDIATRMRIIRSRKLNAIRFFKANRLKASQPDVNIKFEKSIELAIVCASKDLELLPKSVECALVTLKGYTVPRVIVIVPASSVMAAKKILESRFKSPIEIRAEEDCIEADIRDDLRNKFNQRYGWALQQFLKVDLVIKSPCDAVLVVDSDTLLINNRNWLDSGSRQILTPTWELNRSYYDFLSKFGICSITPGHSFVSHHMLMQPKYMIEALQRMNCEDIADVANIILDYKFLDSASPFSIDYELYAQYMWHFHRNCVRLEKWSNLAVSRTDQALSTGDDWPASFSKYFSISLHDYF